jgi:hypothetical protein
MEVQTDFTVAECEDLIILRETDSNPYEIETIEQIKLYEIPTEVIQEPIIYEVAT